MGSKTESTLLNMVLTLFIISLVSATSLGYVYELTKGPIDSARLKKKVQAIQKVLPHFDNNPSTEMYMIPTDLQGDSLECYPAKNGAELVGTAIKTFSDKGFSQRIYLMVGLLNDGTVNNIQVLEHKETPGLGNKMEKGKSDWSNQFNGKNPATFNIKVKKDGGQVDAITAATISSRAYCDAVERAYKSFLEYGKR